MQQCGSGDGVVLPDDRGLAHVVEHGVLHSPDRPVLSRKRDAGWEDISYRLFADHVRAVARVMLAAGVEHGDRVAVLGATSYEWALADFAALSIGAVTVPVYPTASDEQIRHVVADSGAAWCFAETAEHRSALERLGDDVWRAGVWTFGELDQWISADIAGASDEEFDRRAAKVRADDLATIVYTSGTTGMPKGCMLTHRNMHASSANTVEHLDGVFRDGGSEPATTLLCLPLSHIFGRTILISCLYAGTRTGFLSGFPELFAEAATFRPTFLALVPYALEKIRKRASSDESAFGDLDAAFGGRFTSVICGGASLDDTTAAFFAGMGVEILGAYGLTEAATAVTINPIDDNRVGSVGRPIPGTVVAIAEDDEVLVSGANVSPGYWAGSAPADPRNAGWLHTGDLGRIDDGYLYITGRRKEILITSGGKNVSPTLLEDRVRLHPLVSNCMVVGDGRAYVTALITVDQTALGGRDLDHDALRADIQSAVDDANSLVSRAESIREFRVLDTDFTLAGGHLTPSMKLRRKVIERDFAEHIAVLYP